MVRIRNENIKTFLRRLALSKFLIKTLRVNETVVNVPNRKIGEAATIPRVWGPHLLNVPLFFWAPFAISGTTVVLLRSGGVRCSIWPLHIHICVRVVQQYQRRCLNVYPTSLIQVEFPRFQQGLSVTGHSIPIFRAA